MKKSIIWIIAVLVLVGIAIGAAALYDHWVAQEAEDAMTTDTSQETTAKAPPSGSTNAHAAPDFTVTDMNGNKVKLSDMKGKPVVLNFWATWCYYCTEEMPAFNEVYKEYGDDVVFMMVNMTDGNRETVDVATSYVTEKEYEFPVYFDTDLEAAVAYSVTSLPTTYFVDANGSIVTYQKGAMSAEALKSKIAMITNEP